MSTAQRAVTRFKQLDDTDTDGDAEAVDAAADAASIASSGAPMHLRTRSVDKSRRFSDHEEHLYFWMPLLIGLTELTFDPRPTVRRSALDVLFDILHEHGACYSKGFWAKVFERMLLPIFDSVQVDDIDLATFVSAEAASEEAERDRWLYETCSHCLHHLIDLMVKFYPLVHQQLPKVLLKIKAFMLRTHHSLACVGVTAMERLITRSGPFMDRDMWQAAMAGILEVARETVPDLAKVVSYPESRYQRSAGDSGAHPAIAHAWCPCIYVDCLSASATGPRHGLPRTRADGSKRAGRSILRVRATVPCVRLPAVVVRRRGNRGVPGGCRRCGQVGVHAGGGPRGAAAEAGGCPRQRAVAARAVVLFHLQPPARINAGFGGEADGGGDAPHLPPRAAGAPRPPPPAAELPASC